MSSSALPPLGNLPSWSRVSTLDRSRYPKPFARDRLQALPPPGGNLLSNDVGSAPFSMDIQLLDNLTATEQQRLLYYDKSIKFLQQQHADTLKKLHDEIEKLKQENKDLQFKSIMGKVASEHNRKSSNESIGENFPALPVVGNEIQSIVLQEEIKDLRLALKNAEGRNALLQHALQLQHRSKSSKASSSISPNDSFLSSDEGSKSALPSGHSSIHHEPSYLTVQDNARPLPFNATLNPLRVRSSPHVDPRSPSVEECEVIIKYLHRLNARQIEENQLLKSDLKHLLYPNKGRQSPRICSTGKSEELLKLPKVAYKGHFPETQASANPDRVMLPALKQTMNMNVAERKKRQKAVLKARKGVSFPL